MKKKYIWWIVATVIVAGLIFWFVRNKKAENVALFIEVKQGEFEVLVTVTGELQAKNFTNIMGPNFATGVFRWGEYKILDMIAEGTVVEKGDYIAEIDRTIAKKAIIEREDLLQRQAYNVETTGLDTSLNLRNLRDEIVNRAAVIENIRLKLQAAIYEPPATIKQIEFELETAQRALEQQQRGYESRLRHNTNWMRDVERQYDRWKKEYDLMLETIETFTIRAPEKGMLIYRRERNSQKRKVGSSINPSDNVVALLPDLSLMLSRCFVNEIDISKIKLGQEASISIDAFPDKKYTGKINSIANIGEQLTGSDAKWFEVMLELNESDQIMRPSMTTSNKIIISSMSDVTYVSLEAIYSQDSIPFVYTTHQTKQIVLLGEANDTEIVVEQGLTTGDKVYVTVPEDSENWVLVGEELIPIIRDRAIEKKKALEADSKAGNDKKPVKRDSQRSGNRGQASR